MFLLPYLYNISNNKQFFSFCVIVKKKLELDIGTCCSGVPVSPGRKGGGKMIQVGMDTRGGGGGGARAKQWVYSNHHLQPSGTVSLA